MTENFGSYLKSERELRGVTLEEVASKTKIHIRYLQALEKNQFDVLPGEVFVKGYIRSIALVIGANESEILSAYADITKKLPDNDSGNQNISIEQKPKLDINFIFLLGLIIIFLAGVIWGTSILFQKSKKVSIEPSPTAFSPNQEETEEMLTKNLFTSDSAIEDEAIPSKEADILFGTQATLSIQPTPSIENSSNAVKNEEGPSTLFPENNMPLKLTIKTRDNVWFNITVDDSRVEDFMLAKGVEKIFYGKDHYLLSVGDRNAIDLKLNDRTLSLPKETTGKVVQNFIINSQLID